MVFYIPILFRMEVLCNGGGLTQIPDDLPTSVEHLSLTKNKISELPTDAFRRFKRLRKLYLDGNAITSIKQFAFRGLSHLQEVGTQIGIDGAIRVQT